MRLPPRLFAYIWRTSARHQVALAVLSMLVFALCTVPLELQRRIVNDAVARGATDLIVGLALAGVSLSEPLLQGGILLSIFGYLLFLEPWLALLSLAVFSPQLVFVPVMQRAINRRASARIRVLRDVSGGIVQGIGADGAQQGRFERVFALNMGIFKLKFSMNFLMNLMHHLGVAVALGIGGWLAARGEIQVGTVVAFVSGLGKVNDPWGDLVNWFREMTVVDMRYRMVTDAMQWLEQGEPAPA